jgi:hypothetical protein
LDCGHDAGNGGFARLGDKANFGRSGRAARAVSPEARRPAQLGFHAAWRPEAGRQVTSLEGTELLMDNYPQQVRDWIARRGGLTPHMIFLSGRELASMYPTCQ